MSEKKTGPGSHKKRSLSGRYLFVTITVLVLISIYAAYKLLDVENDVAPIRVSVVVEDSGNLRWGAFMAGIEQAASDNNVEITTVTTSLFDKSSDRDALIRQEKADGADHVITSPGEHIYPDPAEQVGHLFNMITEDYGQDLTDRTFIFFGADPKDEYDVRRMDYLAERIRDAGGNIKVRITRPYDASSFLKSSKRSDIVVALDDRALSDCAQYMSEKKGRKRKLYGIGNSPDNVYYLDHLVISGMVVTDEFTRGYENIMYIINASDADVIVSSYPIRPEEIYEKDNQKLLFP